MAVLVKDSADEFIFDPALFREPVSELIWRERITRDSMEGVNFRRSSKLAYKLPFSYEGDSCGRDKMLKIRQQELEQNSNLKVFDTLVSTVKYRRACFMDELKKTKRGKWEKLKYFRNCHEFFRRLWICSYMWDEFLENLNRVEYWFDIPKSTIEQNFELDDPMLQANLQFHYWEHMNDICCQLEVVTKKLWNLSNKSEQAQQWQEFMEMEEFSNVWYSPFGARIWAKFGFDIL